ncbi:MAG: hypothetical protein IKM38_05270 [Christensenellaceae bacterium]|nr:hypothetical protein [Christensenellaceae bacterium]
MKDYLKQHSIVYRQPAKFPEDGAAIGNRYFAGLVWSDKGNYSAVLAKDDVGDHRAQPFEVARMGYTHKKVLELLKNGDQDFIKMAYEEGPDNPDAFQGVPYPYEGRRVHSWAPFPAPKVAAWFTLDTANYKFIEQRLALENATVTTKYEGLEIKSLMPANCNVFVTDIKADEAAEFTAKFRRHADPGMEGVAPAFSTKDGVAVFTYPFPDGFSYSMAFKVEGGEYTVDESNVFIRFKADKTARILASVASSYDTEDTVSEAIALLSKVDEALGKHEAYWDKFWAESRIQLTDKYLENMWYASLYQAAVGNSPNFTCGASGLFWIHEPYAWNNDIHEVNEAYKNYALQAAGHPELSLGYLTTYYNMIPYVRETTKKFYGFDALRFPHTSGYKGEERETWPLNFKYQYMQCSSGLTAQVVWDQYRFTQDKEELKNRIYPIIAGSADFYANYMQKEEDGKYHIYPTFSPEQWASIYCRDATIDLAMARCTLRAAIESAEILGVDEDKAAVWKDVLDNFCDYPRDEKGFLEYDKDDRSYAFGHDSIMYAVHPTAEYDEADEDAWRDALDMSIKRVGIDDNASFSKTHMAVDALWLGLPELGYNLIYDTAVTSYLKPNGFGALGDVYEGKGHISNLKKYPEDFVWEYGNVYDKREVFSVINPHAKDSIQLDVTIGGMLLFVNEMLLQSQKGLIRVFKGLPAHQDAAFDGLLARGGVKVSSERKNGKIGYVKLKAIADTTVSLENPFAGEEITINGEAAESDAILTFNMKKGEEIILAKASGAVMEADFGYHGEAEPRKVFRTLVQPLGKGARNGKITGEMQKCADTAEIWLGKPAE